MRRAERQALGMRALRRDLAEDQRGADRVDDGEERGEGEHEALRRRAGIDHRVRPTHSPWRISGSAVPSAAMPSTSVSAEPIIQSTWMRLRLAPAAASAASSRFWSHEALRIGLAEGDVAGGVLVEERVVEEQAALRDRVGMRDEGHLAQAAGALVRADHALEHRLAGAGAGLGDAAGLEADADVADQGALVGQRLAGRDHALGHGGVGGGEDLLGRDVGVAGDAVLGGGGAAHPGMALGEADLEVRPRAAEAQRGVAAGIQHPALGHAAWRYAPPRRRPGRPHRRGRRRRWRPRAGRRRRLRPGRGRRSGPRRAWHWRPGSS